MSQHQTETIRGYQIEVGDQLVGHGGSVVEVVALDFAGGQMSMTYRCANGDVLDMAVHGGLTQRRVIVTRTRRTEP